ncbi:MAG: glycosyltransferase family 2 protein [Bacilli bacterium]|nr:glycosyltransferase family 2 protein [Bacilli bacterium]
MKVLIIIPVYNEEQNIINTVNSLNNIDIKGIKLDYMVINDGSIDNTKDILIENNIKFIDLPCNLGIGGAVQTGYKYALYNNYDVAIQFDGDGQHNSEYIKDLIKGITDGYDFVLGSRFIGNINTFKSTTARRIGSGFISSLIKLCTKKTITDPTSGFRACNKEVIKLFASEYPTDYPEPDTLVVLLKNNYKVLEIPAEMNKRNNGASSITFFKSIYYMIKVSLSIIITSIEKRRTKI